jgi:hypothetical protein
MRDVPWGVHNDAQDLRLESFQNFNVGGGNSAPELYTIGPDGFEYGFSTLYEFHFVTATTPFLVFFPEVSLCDHHFVCMPVYSPRRHQQILNTRTNLYETGMPIKTTEHISTAYFINRTHQFV